MTSRLGFAAALLFALPLSVAAGSLSAFFRTVPAMNHIDYKSLEFTCSREEDHVPTPTPEAEALFQRARDAHNRATAGERLDKPLMQQAMDDYRRAAEAGHWKAVRNLAYLHMQGLKDESGGKPFLRADSDKTLPYVRKLIDMNVATGYALMASFAAEGWGVRQDDKAAKIYQRRAADLGHVPSQQHLGRVFLLNFNKLPPKERDQIVEIGRKMLACAVRQGNREAALDLATEYKVDDNYPYALFYYHQGAKMGDATCLYALEDWFAKGENGYAPDPKRAKLYHDYAKRAGKIGAGRFPDLDKEIPLPPPPKGGAYPPPEAGWPSQWTKPVQTPGDNG
ncbi:MAG: sel1 repeat family protein [Rhodocyclales bacterium GT-UBC]|nr:MAG: sel1 repeat family protein [Rhodocyclales bacterium GT-UBC]